MAVVTGHVISASTEMAQYPPLIEMTRKFEADLGLSGTLVEVVDGACVQLSIDGTGLALNQRAERAYDALYRAGGASGPPRVAAMKRAVEASPVGALEPLYGPVVVRHRDFPGKISALHLGGCWVGSVLCVLPWAASLEPNGPDAYTRNCQCCAMIPVNCGNRYERIEGTNSFRASDDDIEAITAGAPGLFCSGFRPTPGCGCRLCCC